ncbi:MAG TPA: nicotinic acid mononucleotide adenylyltransferase [Peptococcaceae bacterium]|nr:MAG: putative nicotinate-nucleotide adenylyltransferase [Clostridia bacterium 41_269]HBT20334.1 nicotinic acid mononucleotide adenylyltransferase [Peptococcaceae bacterium]
MIKNKSNEEYRALGIMGGTFDPIHYGHLVTAEEARCQFDLDAVIFVPSGKPPHKKNYRVSDAKHRYLMTVLAVVTNPFFDVSRTEIDREGYSYTIDTVREFREKYPNTEIFFITGADAILEILTWKKVEEVMDHCRFIAATRPGYNLNDLDKKFKTIMPEYSSRIQTIEVPALAISSTDIRRRVANNMSIKYLVPEAVEQYILKNNLYKS